MSFVALTTVDIPKMGFMGIGCQILGQFCHFLVTFMAGKTLSRCQGLSGIGFAVAIPAGNPVP
jgi:hypothetical protein